MSEVKNFSLEVAGKKLTIETGKLANQAHGSCTVQYGDTEVLATVVQAPEPREGIDYFPLLVDYEERLYAAGKIKGSRFIKREGRPTDEAILTARMIDRSIRPLFRDTERKDVQVIVTVLSVDHENDPDIPSLLAASLALGISAVPWNGPIAAIRVGRINNEWVLNPSYEARSKSDLDLVITGTPTEVVMIEGQAKETDEKTVSEAIEFGHKYLSTMAPFLQEIIKKVGTTKITTNEEIDTETMAKLKQKVTAVLDPKIKDLFHNTTRQEYHQKIASIKQELDKVLKQDNKVSKEERTQGLKFFEETLDSEARQLVLNKKVRVDGRKPNELRPIEAAVGILPRTHGSGLFQRGETQILSIVTLASPSAEQTLDGMEEEGKKRYMHHYNFPGFSVGEVAPVRSPGRREIGHGALAEKALLPVLPDKEQFPYTIRVVSEVLSSNGSSSQASICGSSLALMDAGVPIARAVAGVAMGLLTDPQDKSHYTILTDIQGIEDHAGDMDFKIAGTNKGITAIQLDIKLGGLSIKILNEAITQAKETRLEILKTMTQAIAEPRADLSPYAPRITSFRIPPDKIRSVIGPGGKVINEIIDATNVQIDIEDDGLVMVTAVNPEAATKAVEWIKNLTREVVVGEVFQGKVTRLMNFGAFVEVLPKQEGLVHISELAWHRVDRVEDVVKIGDIIPVKVIEIDEQGRINLSHKQTLPRPQGLEESNNNFERPARRQDFRRNNSRPPRSGVNRFHH
ncbi:MAG: polyribonucleotide nucleotidyltransferase [Patescibacteria group bacterium]